MHVHPGQLQSNQDQSRNDAAAWSEAACHCTYGAIFVPALTDSILSIPARTRLDDIFHAQIVGGCIIELSAWHICLMQTARHMHATVRRT